ncbi:hypothetical protein [Nonomuraea sp. NPDC050783]|uniref:hypothetical protein n=1 Tax=Nonomuraea sp. NPDC050783 TaxID=3154634 RepID=UPI0034657F4F
MNADHHRDHRIRRPLFVAATAVLMATGGAGAGVAVAAAGATPADPPTATPTDSAPPTDSATPTDTITITATATEEPPTDTPTGTPTATPTPELAPLSPWGFVGAMHGEFAVATKDGCGSVTLFAQTGQATAVSEDSITVRSQDGLEKTYTIGEDTQTIAGRRGTSPIRQDDWVSVTAVPADEGGNGTALYVYDLSRPVKRTWKGWGRGWHWWAPAPSWRTPATCPTPTSPTTPTATPPTVTSTATPPTPTVTPTATPTATPTITPPTPPTDTPTTALTTPPPSP